MIKKDRVIVLDDDELAHEDLIHILTISLGKLIANPVITTSFDDFERGFGKNKPWDIVVIDFQHQAFTDMRPSDVDAFIKKIKAHRFSPFLFIGISGNAYQKSYLESSDIKVLYKTYHQEQFSKLLGLNDPEIKIESIKEIICEEYGIDHEELVAKNKKDDAVWARYAVMHFSKMFTDASLKRIGAHLGGRDHTSVIHGCEQVKEQLETDEAYREKMLQLGSKIGKWFQTERKLSAAS